MLSKFVGRAAIDIGSGVSKLFLIDASGHAIDRVVEVPYSYELSLSQSNELNEAIMKRGIEVMREFKEVAAQNGVEDAIVGIATACFRRASNAHAFIDRVRNELGIDISVISQADEGRLGLETAIAASAFDRRRVVSLDNGGASFQVATFGASGEVHVYEGPFGSTSSLNLLLESVRGQTLGTVDVQTVNPISRDESKVLVRELIKRLPERPQWLDKRDAQYVAIGEYTSVYKLVATLTGRESFTAADVDVCVDQVCDKTNAQLEQYRQPELVVAKLCLVSALLSKLAPNATVRYVPTIGSCLGVLAMTYNAASANDVSANNARFISELVVVCCFLC
jgi:exopolyphosphatase/pppGpp-phosphohydrolase